MCHSDVEMGTAFTTHHFEGCVADNTTDPSVYVVFLGTTLLLRVTHTANLFFTGVA